MKNIILVDFKIDKDWSFPKIFGEDKWIAYGKVTNHLHGSLIKTLLRYAIYFLFPLQIVIQRKRYDKIIAWQQFYGLNYAFWCRLLHVKKKNELTVLTFIYKKKSGGVNRLYHKYMNYIVTSQYIDRFICFSNEECAYYADLFGVDVGKFVYVPLGLSVFDELNVGDDGYVFATGRSNRNYDFLVEALNGTDYKCTIASDSYHAKADAGKVTVLNDCYGDDMLKLMARCHCVAIPLKDLKMSSGQLVVLQAMSLGKPVICTASDGIKDYVEHGVTGLLVDNNKKSWLEALRQLYVSDGCYEEMSKNAKAVYHRDFTEERMFQRISNVVNGEVW